MKFLLAAILLALPCIGATPDVAVYPAATVEQQATQSARQEHPEGIVYTTTDAFEKVGAFYKKAGGEEVRYLGTMTDTFKLAVFGFPGKMYTVQVSWTKADPKHRTLISMFVKK